MSNAALKEFRYESGDDAGMAYTLPSKYYYDPALYEAERSKIFGVSWVYVCHRSQFSEPGSYVTMDVAGAPVFVLRDRQGRLKAFHNVCRHRGHKLLEGEGKLGPVITCPYHGWAYGQDGSLRTARNSQCVANFDANEFPLVPVRVEEFCTFIFINFDPNAESLKAQAGEVETGLREWLPQLEEITFSRRLEIPVKANWKVVADNFLECYHCDVAHKALVEGVNDMTTYKIEIGSIWSSHISHGTANQGAYDHSQDGPGFVGYYLWPNTTLGIYPGSPNMINHIFRPDGPERCVQVFDFLFSSPDPDAAEREMIRYVHEVLAPEDNALMEGVQQGFRSPVYSSGRLMVDTGRTYLSEHALYHFQGMVFDALEPGHAQRQVPKDLSGATFNNMSCAVG